MTRTYGDRAHGDPAHGDPAHGDRAHGDRAGLGTMTHIVLRTGRTVIAAWVLGIIAMMVMTGTSIDALYPTPDALAGYATSLGESMVILNGRIAGMNTLGGVLANEFATVAGFGLPLMAIALVGRATRKDEEAGRLELLRAAQIGRHAPLLAAVLVAVVAILVTGIGLAVAMLAVGVPVRPAALYSAAVVGLGLVFIGVTAVAAQVFPHHRAVWGAGLTVMLASYLLRGWASVRDHAAVWVTPHGWLDLVRSAGDDPRPGVLALPLLAFIALLGLAFSLNTRRDVGAALIRSRGSAVRASPLLRSPLGLAWYEHRWPIIGWTIATALLMGLYGSLTQEVINAIRDNPALGDLMGLDPAAATEIFLPSMLSYFLLMLAMLAASFAVMAIGSLRGEEQSGRLECELSGARSRARWLGTHLVVVAVGAVVIGIVGAVSLGYGVASATGEPDWFGEILQGASPYLAPVAAFLGIVVGLFGLRPRWQPLGWAIFTLAALIAYLGPGFNLPGWLVNASLFQALGTNVLGEGASQTGMIVVSGLAVALIAAGWVGFTRRDIPIG